MRHLLLLAVLLFPSMAFALPGLDLPDLGVPPLALHLGSRESLSGQATTAAVQSSLPGPGLESAGATFAANLPNLASSSGGPGQASVAGDLLTLNLLPADLVPGLPDPLLPKPLLPGLPDPLLPPNLVIPEPGTALLLGGALLALGFARRRR